MYIWCVQGRRQVQFSSVTQSCPALCDPMNRSTPGLPVHHQLLEFTQTHIHRVGDAIQPSLPLSSPSPPAPNPSQHQSFPMSQLFAWGKFRICQHHHLEPEPLTQSCKLYVLYKSRPAERSQWWWHHSWIGQLLSTTKGLHVIFFLPFKHLWHFSQTLLHIE